MIETNINAKYYNEKKMADFLEKALHLPNPREFKENSRFYAFLFDDLKKIVQQVLHPPLLGEVSKLVVYYDATDDPELLDILANAIVRNFRFMPIDDICNILVNFAHTLSPNTQDLFNMAN